MTTPVPATLRKPTTPHPVSGTGVRPTARVRPTMRVALKPGPDDGFRPDDPYVLRFWVATMGSGATEDLLRLVKAGQSRKRIKRPLFLHVLIAHDLVGVDGTGVEDGVVRVVSPIPPVPAHLERRFSPGLRAQHRRWLSFRQRSARVSGRRAS